jgi:hypothetical protein
MICCLVLGLAMALVFSLHRLFVFQQKSSDQLNRKNDELRKANAELQTAMDNLKTLKGLLPICAHCKKIRDDSGYWQQIETYVSQHSEADFSHGICPECMEKYFPDLCAKIKNRESGKVHA